MADLTDIQAAQSVKIIGADSAGVENAAIESAIATPSLAASGLVVRPLPFETVTYAAVASAFTSAATATDVFVITGSATKTIRVNRVIVSGTTTSGSPIKITVNLIKRSAANTGGTVVADTEVPYDSTSPAATAVVTHYTANPSGLGASLGVIRSTTTSIQASGFTEIIVWDFKDERPLILRGTSEILAVNFNSTSITGSVISITVEWAEV